MVTFISYSKLLFSYFLIVGVGFGVGYGIRRFVSAIPTNQLYSDFFANRTIWQQKQKKKECLKLQAVAPYLKREDMIFKIPVGQHRRFPFSVFRFLFVTGLKIIFWSHYPRYNS